ncbi:hypothetical protein CsSME_00006895 [Camellia sinensis var. sinensis]
MEGRVKLIMVHIVFVFFLSLSSFTVSLSATSSRRSHSLTTKENPFTPKASLIRFWNNHISTNLPTPHFLLSKASPLSATTAAHFTKLAAQNALSSHLPSFCSAANLFCPSSSTTAPPLTTQNDSNFASYSNKHFTTYGTAELGGAATFKNYSDGINFAAHSFSRYGRSATGHNESFASYATDGNVADSNFSSYGADATGGSGEFQNYQSQVNVPNLLFASYDSDGNDHKLSFSKYTEDTNSGSEGFINYGKNGNGVPAEFTAYGEKSNIVGSTFLGYGDLGNAANDSFKSYSSNSNNPNNNFKRYGSGGALSAIDSFSSYRDGANTGKDNFQSYAKNSNSGKASFSNYGKTFNGGIDSFKEYGKGSMGHSIGFKVYGANISFKDYAKKGVEFAQYTNSSSSTNGQMEVSGKSVNSWVEQGKFFREAMLKEGNIMKIPDIQDKMPERSFLPSGILSKIPFSKNQILELKRIFHASDGSTLESVMVNTLSECERSPSPGETKRCASSAEEMINFAVSILGSNVVVRTTENVNGSNQRVMLGEVKGINGGKVTKSVSCHQSLYPYLLYYCHFVPKVKVYVADILDVETKVKINDGVAICHVDTSAWSPGHGAFVALGSSPGLIEVCHWIFENDMTWTIAD